MIVNFYIVTIMDVLILFLQDKTNHDYKQNKRNNVFYIKIETIEEIKKRQKAS